MEYFSTVYRELRHNYLAHIGIKSIAYLPPLAPTEESSSYRTRWAEMLHQSRHEYMKDDDATFNPDDMELPQKPRRATKLALSFPSTASSHTLVSTGQDDLHVPHHPHSPFRRFGMRRKKTDSESFAEPP